MNTLCVYEYLRTRETYLKFTLTKNEGIEKEDMEKRSCWGENWRRRGKEVGSFNLFGV